MTSASMTNIYANMLKSEDCSILVYINYNYYTVLNFPIFLHVYLRYFVLFLADKYQSYILLKGLLMGLKIEQSMSIIRIEIHMTI